MVLYRNLFIHLDIWCKLPVIFTMMKSFIEVLVKAIWLSFVGETASSTAQTKRVVDETTSIRINHAFIFLDSEITHQNKS